MDTRRTVYPAPADEPREQMEVPADIRGMIDVCVKCGLCLEHCPTYRISGLEGESPRGRIALVEGLIDGALPPSGRTADHLESCTGCLTCEAVCPALVPYGQLIDAGRAELRRRGAIGAPGSRWLARLARRPRIMRSLVRLLRVLRRLGLDRIAMRIRIFRGKPAGRLLERLPLPTQAETRRADGVLPGEKPTSVMLFEGCVSGSLDRKTIVDAVTVLEATGAVVSVPHDQVCCGALDLHDGRPDTASHLAGINCRTFEHDAAPVLTLASGCAATLSHYGRLSATGGECFISRLQDVLGYVDDQWASIGYLLSALNMRVAVFEPCSVRNRAPAHSRTTPVLERLPGLEIIELDPGYGCCGAAGHHFITRPEQADALLDPILTQIDAISPDAVAVPNIGCALHISGALMARGAATEVLHPVSLIARSLAGSR